ncbi:MAG TPA: tetratricopeptide repeat protein, partial [Acidobacteriota bacterium]|nr:tetratricopeptide repeat protein [Acidobacteriota bacterium]
GQMLDLRKKTGDERGAAGALREMGILSFRLSQNFSQAKARFDEARQIANRLGDVSTQASIDLALGNIQKGLSANLDAVASYESALAISKKSGDLYNQGISINNLGTLYQKTGEFHKAAEYLHQSLALRRQQKDRFGEKITLINLGHVFFDLNNFEQALDSYTKALSLCSDEAKTRDCIDIQMYIANTFTKNGQPARAISLLTEILENSQKQNLSEVELEARHYLAPALLQNNEPEKAIECLTRLLPLLKTPAKTIHKTKAYWYLTRAYSFLHNVEAANEAATSGLALSRTIGDKPTEMGLISELAKLNFLKGNLPEAKVQLEQALAISEQIRRDAGNIDAKTSYFTNVRELYDFYIRILMRLDQKTPGGVYSREALRCSELARARSLNERLAAAQVEIQVDDASGLMDQVKRLREKISNQQALLTKLSLANQPEAKTEPVRAQITGLEAELSQKLNQLYQQNPKLAQLQNPVILTAEEIQKTLLDPETALVEFLVGPQEVCVWLVTADDITSFVIKDAEQVKHLGKQCVAFLQPESSGMRFKPGSMTEFSTVSQQLSQLLFGPIESKLRNKKRLLVVADDVLQLLPLAALPLPVPQNQTSSSSGAPPEPYV